MDRIFAMYFFVEPDVNKFCNNSPHLQRVLGVTVRVHTKHIKCTRSVPVISPMFKRNFLFLKTETVD